MSVVLAVCSTEFCAMLSDGRMVEETGGAFSAEPKILTEELPKVRKINARVCVGFAGDALAAVQIINALDEYNVQYLTMEKILKILAEKGRTVECKPVGVRLLVGGRNRKGEQQLVMLGSAENYEPAVQCAKPGSYLIEGACSHTEIEPFLAEWVQPKAAEWKTLDDIALTLQGCVEKIAAVDPSVNTNYYRQLIY